MRILTLRAMPTLVVTALTTAATMTSGGLAWAQSAPSSTTNDPTATSAAMPAMQDVVIPVQETRPGPNVPMLLTGTVLLGGTYGASAIGAWQSIRHDDQKLYYPLVGPWMDLANRDCGPNPCSDEGLNKTLLIADGVAQGVGALLMVTSLFVPNGKRFLMFSAKNETTQFTVTPSRLASGGYGMAAVGTF